MKIEVTDQVIEGVSEEGESPREIAHSIGRAVFAAALTLATMKPGKGATMTLDVQNPETGETVRINCRMERQ